MMRFFSRITSEVLQVWQREETSARMRSCITMRVSGYLFNNQRGGVAEGVQSTVYIPFLYNFSTTVFSQPS